MKGADAAALDAAIKLHSDSSGGGGKAGGAPSSLSIPGQVSVGFNTVDGWLDQSNVIGGYNTIDIHVHGRSKL